MALPENYGPEANDSGDARLTKIHILLWNWLRPLIQNGTAPAVSTSSGGSAVDLIEIGGAAVTAGAGNVAAGTQRVTLAGDDPAVSALATTNTNLTSLQAATEGDYETVAAGQTDQMLGPTGAAGDYLSGLLVIPATTSPGAISIEDGATNIPVFTGGANSVTSLTPFFIPLGIRSVSGGWEVTTGTNVAVIGIGKFT